MIDPYLPLPDPPQSNYYHVRCEDGAVRLARARFSPDGEVKDWVERDTHYIVKPTHRFAIEFFSAPGEGTPIKEVIDALQMR